VSRLLVFLILIFTIQSRADESCKHDETSLRCVKYIKNYDADTITFNIPDVHPLIGKKMSVRVRHVDTPEMKSKLPCEREASRNAQRLVENMLENAKRIDLVNVDKDKYFRILADVIIDGQNLKDYLIKNQLAYAYEGGTKQRIDWCSRRPASK
jgi:micrococcal nuclease